MNHTVAVGRSSFKCIQDMRKTYEEKRMKPCHLSCNSAACLRCCVEHSVTITRCPDSIEGLLDFTAADCMQGGNSRNNSVTSTFQWLQQVLAGLQGTDGWRASHTHLFGFSQGGSAALHLALHCRSATVHALFGRCLHLAALLCRVYVPCSDVLLQHIVCVWTNQTGVLKNLIAMCCFCTQCTYGFAHQTKTAAAFKCSSALHLLTAQQLFANNARV